MSPPDASPPPLGYLIHEVSRLIRRRFEEEARVHGITMPQWRALAEIARNEGISQVALAGCIDSDPMTLSGILDRLEKRKLIARLSDPADSRAKLARMTPKGRALVDMAKNVGRGLVENALDGVTEADRQILTGALIRVRDNLNGVSAEYKELQS